MSKCFIKACNNNLLLYASHSSVQFPATLLIVTISSHTHTHTHRTRASFTHSLSMT